MKHRKVLAWAIFAALIANCTISVLSYQREGKVAIELQDELGNRLPKMVNADAEVQSTAGTGATASVDGNDAVGQVNITTGTSPSAGSLVHIKFTKPYAVQPFVIIAPLDQSPPPKWYTTVDTNGFDILVGTAPEADTNYPFSYFVVARPWLMYLTG